MDGMADIPNDALDEIYNTTSDLLAAEWALIGQVKDVKLRHRLTVAHGRLHYYLADQAAAHGIPGGVQTMSGGGDKPPRPS
jgi:hypothetical protein